MKEKIDLSKKDEKIKKESAFIDLLTMEINKKIIGQNKMIERLLVGLLGRGHVLLEGVPGLAKTLAINSLSDAVKGTFHRIQFLLILFFVPKFLFRLIKHPRNLVFYRQIKVHIITFSFVFLLVSHI